MNLKTEKPVTYSKGMVIKSEEDVKIWHENIGLGLVELFQCLSICFKNFSAFTFVAFRELYNCLFTNEITSFLFSI